MESSYWNEVLARQLSRRRALAVSGADAVGATRRVPVLSVRSSVSGQTVGG
jgi:hypothetical protein